MSCKITEAPDSRAVAALAVALTRLRSTAAMCRFLDEIFTPAELHDLALRWRLLEMLRAGVPQRVIAQELGISLCKITRGARVLKRPHGASARLLRPPVRRARPNHP